MAASLIVVDVQYDFIDGTLAVDGANDILSVVHELLEQDHWVTVVASQDFHPPGHISFASTHGVAPMQIKQVPHPVTGRTGPNGQGETVPQMMWPDHCVQGTRGCALEDGVQFRLDQREREEEKPTFTIRKGDNPLVDGYSAFSLNHYVGFTPLARRLGEYEVQTVVICGLATDYCCKATAIDARKFGFRAIIVSSAMRGVSAEGHSKALEEMEQWGCEIVENAADIASMFGA